MIATNGSRITMEQCIQMVDETKHNLEVNVENAKIKVVKMLIGDKGEGPNGGYGRFKQNIQDGSYFGTPWPPLSPNTLRRRKWSLKKFHHLRRVPGAGGTKPLLETGLMYDAMAYESRRLAGVAGKGYTVRIFIDPRRFKGHPDARHNRRYAHFHNWGKGSAPQRQFIGDKANSMVYRHLQDCIFGTLGLPIPGTR